MTCLLCVSFLDRSGVIASVELDSVLVENAENGTSTSKSAGSPDFIYRMSCNIEVHNSLLSIELLHLAGRNRRQRYNHLLLQLDYMLCRFPESKYFVGQGTHLTNTSDGLVSGNRMLLESIRSWMLMMRMTLTRQNSRNIASSRLPRKALENFGITSSSPLCNAAMSCFHSGLWRLLSSLSSMILTQPNSFILLLMFNF